MHEEISHQVALKRQKSLRAVLSGALLAAAVALSACLPTNISALGPNMIRLDFRGADTLSDETALKEALARAAKETLARGYTLFRFTDWAAGPPQTITPGQPATANFAVTVVMFREGEQGANPFFDARQIVKVQ
ncbi:hypothetical protein [Methylocystis sp. JR02]|uniref:hypothetical protein n=1 Tax=Methylocystis sp. JR02 TaxID=3046284 RepID=UPI0024B9FDC8|nr:hypothetical protein [Methylocystis sp. JR02]MDJ0448435.1 hypothetical protein [Methylocystis sp. JR02]